MNILYFLPAIGFVLLLNTGLITTAASVIFVVLIQVGLWPSRLINSECMLAHDESFLGVGRPAFHVFEPGFLPRSIFRLFSRIPLQVDRQLAIRARRSLPIEAVRLRTSRFPFCGLAALRVVPMGPAGRRARRRRPESLATSRKAR